MISNLLLVQKSNVQFRTSMCAMATRKHVVDYIYMCYYETFAIAFECGVDVSIGVSVSMHANRDEFRKHKLVDLI